MITEKHQRLIDHVSGAFANELTTFEQALSEMVGDVIDHEYNGQYDFDLYFVEPLHHYLSDINRIPQALLEFKKQTNSKDNFTVIIHNGIALIFANHKPI